MLFVTECPPSATNHVPFDMLHLIVKQLLSRCKDPRAQLRVMLWLIIC